jgi:hypothetical protein
MLRFYLLSYHTGVGNTGPQVPLQEGSKTDLVRESIQEKRRDFSRKEKKQSKKDPIDESLFISVISFCTLFIIVILLMKVYSSVSSRFVPYSLL